MKRVCVLLVGEVLEDPRVLRTCQSLAAAGAEVTVGCTNPSGRPEAETAGPLSIRRFPHRREFIVKRLYEHLHALVHPRIGRIMAGGHENVPVSPIAARVRNLLVSLNFRRYLTETVRINRAMADAFDRETFDLVHANDVDTLHAGVALKTNGSAKTLVYDAHEYWAGIGVRGSRPNDELRKLEREGCSHADHLVTVSPQIAGRLAEDYDLPVTPSVMLNCPERYDGSVYVDTVHAPVRVVYQGMFKAFRGLAELVEAFSLIDDAELTLSGYGPLENGLRRLTDSLGIADRVHFAGRFYPGENMALLAQHDIGVMTFRDVTMNMVYVAPNKLFDYAMAGCAVVGSRMPFLESTIGGYGMGMIFDEITPRGIADTLSRFIVDAEKIRECKQNARAAALETFTWEKQFAANYPW